MADVAKHRGGGVSRVGDKFRARLRVEGSTVSLGTFATREEAELVVKAALEDVDGGASISGAQPLADWGEKMFERRELRGVIGVEKERSCWRRHVARHTLGSLPLRGVSRLAVVRWLDWMVHDARAGHAVRKGNGTEVRETGERLSRQTVVHALRLVRAALTAAADAGLIPSNPILDVHVPQASDEDTGDGVSWTWLSLSEIDAVLAADVDERHRIVWTVAIYTGLRRGEMRALQWRDVHLDGDHPRLTLRKTKSGKAREVPLLPPARDALRRWRAVSPGLGSTHVWRPMRVAKGEIDAGRMHEDWDLGWRDHGEPVLGRHVRVHDLRHTCASHLVQGTWGKALNLYAVKEWLGHSSITVTQRYAHLAPDGLRGEAAEMARAFETSGPRVDERTRKGSRKHAE